MHTAKVIVAGLLLLAVFVLCGRVFGGGATGQARGALWFVGAWLLLATGNLVLGVVSAGYGVREELPVFLIVFGVPTAVALLLGKPVLGGPHGVPFTMTELMPHRGESQRAVQVQVAGFQGWGAAVGFDFVYVNAVRRAYDLGDSQALRFWARASNEVELKLQVPNVDTDPYGNRCSGTEGDNACYAHFSRAFTVSTEWREITIPLRDLRQEGTGRRADSFDAHQVFSVFFVIGPKQELTVTIDDVALVK